MGFIQGTFGTVKELSRASPCLDASIASLTCFLGIACYSEFASDTHPFPASCPLPEDLSFNFLTSRLLKIPGLNRSLASLGFQVIVIVAAASSSFIAY